MKTDLWEMDSDKAIEYISKIPSVRAFKLFKAFDLLTHLPPRWYVTMLEEGLISRFELPLLLWFYDDLCIRGRRGQETYLHRLLGDKRHAGQPHDRRYLPHREGRLPVPGCQRHGDHLFAGNCPHLRHDGDSPLL